MHCEHMGRDRKVQSPGLCWAGRLSMIIVTSELECHGDFCGGCVFEHTFGKG